MRTVSVLMKPASGMCNMSCDYCFYRDEIKKREQMSYGFMKEETLKNIIRRTMTRAESMVSYVYQGGEPTLRGLAFFKKALDYQRQYNKKGIQVINALQTNGLLLDEEWCKFLHDNRFLVGLSVDGTCKIHDCNRHTISGDATYDRILYASKLMDQYQVDYNILTVVSRQVAEEIEDIYEDYRRKCWNYQQYIVCMDPLGEEHGGNDYAITPKQYGEFLIKLFELWYQDFKKGNAPYIRHLDNYIKILAGYRPEACGQCGTCNIQYAVEADGSAYPCDFYMLDDYRLGNFNRDVLDVLDQKRREIGFIECSRMLDESCIECFYYKLCRGGCQRNRDYYKSMGKYRNYFCEGYRMFFDACLDRMKEAAEKIWEKPERRR